MLFLMMVLVASIFAFKEVLLEVGKIVEDFQDFEKAITIHQFNLNADISQFSRLNQNIKLLKVIENI